MGIRDRTGGEVVVGMKVEVRVGDEVRANRVMDDV